MSEVLAFFQQSKRIHGFCPCCGEPFRLSDVAVFTREPPPKTGFDQVDDARARLERSVELFEERKQDLREAATRLGQALARRRVRAIAPFFVGRRIDAQDVKVLFDPVRYVHFRGLNGAGVKAVEFIDEHATNRAQEHRQESIGRALRAGNLEWRTLRVGEDGAVSGED